MSVGESLAAHGVTFACTHHHAVFSNILSKSVIERLAEADEYEVVREVQVRPAYEHVPSILT